ncbi:MAG: thioredoxin domain-containing protein [Flavobacteriales bacterium]|nr:thioredoxin domain-containing protein [Flavobacteriales bacterium]
MSFCKSPTDQIEQQETSKVDTTTHKYTNHLINETSPYLLQHAHNPVDWHAWGPEALQKAQTENKLLIISIGYSACHWCHVMEHESFEDEEVAKMMNDNFVCIKIDREERPDIDQIYMNAIHQMGQRGGWPLNMFALPNGRPFTGGTYFPKAHWLDLLGKASKAYTDDPAQVAKFAEDLTKRIRGSELVEINKEPADFTVEMLDGLVDKWSSSFDNKEGGGNRAPKFPIPNNYQFLLRYAHLKGDKDVLDHVKLTLDKIASGGIYDHLGGGFARYSTDATWKVPHFEKMLYDNSQLVSLYSEAYQLTKSPLYKDVVYETLEFVKRELTDKTGAFYSALDADSDGEEGKFYVWSKEELKTALGEDYNVFGDYYNVNNIGLWEGNYILLRKKSDEEIAKKHRITVEQLKALLAKSKKTLMAIRDTRIRPGLDDKSLTSWNALMLNAYVDAYDVFGETAFLDVAIKNAEFIVSTQMSEDGRLNHSYKAGRSTINGYLEDYALTIEAFLALYESTFDQRWMDLARKLADYAILHFNDPSSGMFFFTSDVDPPLVARKMELNDNVIPASNSSFAKSLFLLGHYYYEDTYTKTALQMLNNIKNHMGSYPAGYSNWAMLMLNETFEFFEVAIVGKDASKLRSEMNQDYNPNKLYIGADKISDLPLLQNKFVDRETMIYVCVNKACQLPVTEVSQALEQLK